MPGTLFPTAQPPEQVTVRVLFHGQKRSTERVKAHFGIHKRLYQNGRFSQVLDYT